MPISASQRRFSRLRLSANRCLIALTALSVFALAVASSAVAAGPLISVSDPTITGPTPGLIEAFAPRWHAAGVDLASVTADWAKISPDPQAQSKPDGFSADDPDSPLYNWAELDRVIGALRANGIEPLLTITGPGPLWASSDPAHGDARNRPDADLFAAFAQAVALRYSRSVDRYIIWYEPNLAANLFPQYSCVGKVCEPRSPQIYRDLFNKSAALIRREDPESSVYAGALSAARVGTKSPTSGMPSLAWLRSFECLTMKDLVDRKSAPCKGFAAAAVDGFAYHPEQRNAAPGLSLKSASYAGISDAALLTGVLDNGQQTGGLINHSKRSAPVDLYFTEWGYQTNPPDIFNGITTSAQDRWLQQGARIAYAQKRIKMLGFYLWRDEPIVDSGKYRGSYSGTQSGLFSFDGSPKQAWRSFTDPIWVSAVKGGAQVWGQVRPGAAANVTIDRRVGRSGFKAVSSLTTDAQGYFAVTIPTSVASAFRYIWTTGGSTEKHYSAEMTVKPR